MTNLVLYGKIINLKNRLEICDEKGIEYTEKQIALAIKKVNEINSALDRRKETK